MTILTVDVSYQADRAVAAGVLIDAWEDNAPVRVLRAELDQVAAYVPGQFYKRELPCILALLGQLDCPPEVIVVDGYVYLGSERLPGLGRHLYDALAGRSAVVGVAKTRFKDTPAAEVLRGGSRNPLYITAVGLDETDARHCVARMPGPHRIPTVLKLVDKLSRQR